MSSKIYTRSGDKGKTGIAGGARVDKDDARIEANGEIDEVNSTIGLLRTKLDTEHVWQSNLYSIQKALMDSMAHIATPSEDRGMCSVSEPEGLAGWVESLIDEIENNLDEKSSYFLMPGGTEVSALCHVVRTQLRRAERRLITLHRVDPLPDSILQLVNRLSDLFFSLSRQELQASNVKEERWRLFVYRS